MSVGVVDWVVVVVVVVVGKVSKSVLDCCLRLTTKQYHKRTDMWRWWLLRLRLCAFMGVARETGSHAVGPG
eukprot:1386633-Amorphochlora_amoeboformis.AAC.2